MRAQTFFLQPSINTLPTGIWVHESIITALLSNVTTPGEIVNFSLCPMSHCGPVSPNELQGIWKEAVMAQFKVWVISCYSEVSRKTDLVIYIIFTYM
jgi:hypothetical protein